MAEWLFPDDLDADQAELFALIHERNPRAKLFTDLRMSLRRSRNFNDAMLLYLKWIGENTTAEDAVAYARANPPGPAMAPNDVKKHLKVAFQDDWWRHRDFRNWEETFDLWRTGANDRADKTIDETLPEKVRAKI